MLNSTAIENAWDHLVLTRGDLHHLKGDLFEWSAVFMASVQEDYMMIRPFAVHAGNVMDIGCGVGAIDVMLMRSHHMRAMLIDGNDPHAIVRQQDRPFMSRDVVVRFMKDCGIRDTEFEYCTPEALMPFKADLVLSLRSWCFHYAPNRYLSYVRRCVRRGGKLVLDVRKDRPAWLGELASEFQYLATLGEGMKFKRMLYAAR